MVRRTEEVELEMGVVGDEVVKDETVVVMRDGGVWGGEHDSQEFLKLEGGDLGLEGSVGV